MARGITGDAHPRHSLTLAATFLPLGESVRAIHHVTTPAIKLILAITLWQILAIGNHRHGAAART